MKYINKDELLNKIEFVQFAKDIGIKLEQYNDTVEYRGFCKIKNHNSACFFINKEKQAYYCFGCKQGGGIIQFVMRMKDYSFCETLKYLQKYVIWKDKQLKKAA
jgi:DNA primase